MKNPGRDNQIVEAYRHGESLVGLGHRFGLSHEGARQILKRRGIKLNYERIFAPGGTRLWAKD